MSDTFTSVCSNFIRNACLFVEIVQSFTSKKDDRCKTRGWLFLFLPELLSQPFAKSDLVKSIISEAHSPLPVSVSGRCLLCSQLLGRIRRRYKCLCVILGFKDMRQI